ncbi:uncharacterized protein [Henckelia pumila]|uniref:uncharacterized protein n=1 Tax=Henckelia pumila TaxID=405737 RepID=UPI003C6DF86B
MGPKLLVGGETTEEAEIWIRRMEVCFQEFRCTEEQKMETLDFLIEGRALKWWNSTSAQMIAARGVVTWADFRASFQKLYFPPALRQAKANELLSLRQGTMNIDEYQQKFFDLLSYCPEISSSTDMKYNVFLQGINPEIHDRVAVSDDTTYKGLVSRFHQAEDSLKRNRTFFPSSRTVSSLGPNTQYFKKQGVSYSSFGSGSGGMHHFGKKKGQGQCASCGARHPTEKCRRSGACYRCREMGHMKRDCSQITEGSASGYGSQPSISQRSQGQSVGSTNQRPCVSGQVFALSQDQIQQENEDVIAGIFLLCGIPAFVLIDTGASHSFILARFVKLHRLSYVSLDVEVSVSTPTGHSSLAMKLVFGCPL